MNMVDSMDRTAEYKITFGLALEVFEYGQEVCPEVQQKSAVDDVTAGFRTVPRWILSLIDPNPCIFMSRLYPSIENELV